MERLFLIFMTIILIICIVLLIFVTIYSIKESYGIFEGRTLNGEPVILKQVWQSKGIITGITEDERHVILQEYKKKGE